MNRLIMSLCGVVFLSCGGCSNLAPQSSEPVVTYNAVAETQYTVSRHPDRELLIRLQQRKPTADQRLMAQLALRGTKVSDELLLAIRARHLRTDAASIIGEDHIIEHWPEQTDLNPNYLQILGPK